MLNFVEASKLADENSLNKLVVDVWAEESPALRNMLWHDIEGSYFPYNQEKTLPGIGFRGVNQSWTASTGIINPEIEPLFIAGGELDVDMHIIRTQGEAARSKHVVMKLKALAHQISYSYIKGDNATNPASFDGLQTRITGSQLVSAGSTSGGAALSLFKLDEGLNRVAGDNSTKAILVNSSLHSRFSQAARNRDVGGYIEFKPDEFGQEIMWWNGTRIYKMGWDASGLEILRFSEAASSGSATATSLYIVNWGEEYHHGIQSALPEATDFGQMESEPKARVRVEWDMGIALLHPMSACRVQHIGDLAFVA